MVRVSSCCCGCSLKTGTILIGVYYLIMYIIALGLVSFLLAVVSDDDVQRKILKHEESDFPSDDSAYEKVFTITKVIFGVALAIMILCILVNVLLIVGAVTEKPKLIYTWFVIHIILLVIGTIAIMVNGVSGVARTGSQGGSIISTIINILLTIYFLIVVHSYYKELKEKGEVRQGQPTTFSIEGYPMPPQMYHQPTEPPPYTDEKHFDKGPNNSVNI